jgi:hypothetical protein
MADNVLVMRARPPARLPHGPALHAEMTALVERAEVMFAATTGGDGRLHQTVRTGRPGFVRVVDGRRLVWREPADTIGTAVVRTGPVDLLFVDLFGRGVGLYLTGAARAAGPAAARRVEVTVIASRLDRVGQRPNPTIPDE